jgi:HD superfamily phosphohydrolase YqeK
VTRGNRPMLLYVAAVVLSATVYGVTLAASEPLEKPLIVLALMVANAVGERWTVRLSPTTELSVCLLPTVFAAVALGPLPAGLIAAGSMLGDHEVLHRAEPGRSPRLKWATYTSTRFITGATAGLAAAPFVVGAANATGEIITASLVAMAVAESLDFAFALITGWVRGRSFRTRARSAGPVAITSFLIHSPVVVVLTVAYTTVSPWTLLLFVLPALAFQRLYTLYQRERQLSDDLRDANETLARANLSFAGALVATLDARDRYTAGHSAAVAIYSRDITARLGLGPDLQEKAYLCGLVHDIGKIGLPPGLLEKPGALTLEERRTMQQHSAIGERILANVEQYEDIAHIVRHHHERIDGEGYPDKLVESEIPLLAKIIAVADAYNAMTSDRPYRDAMPSQVARLRLAQAVQSQFDTSVVAAFEAILAAANEDYRLARGMAFRFFGHDEPSEPHSLREVVAGAA